MSVKNGRSRELSQDQKRDRRFGLIILLFLGTISLLLCVILLLPLTVRGTPWLDVSLHSIMAADYRADFNPLLVNPVGMEVVAEVLQDVTGTPTPGVFATIVVELQTPVPTVTPQPKGGVTDTPVIPTQTEPPDIPTSTDVPQATHTPHPPGVPTPTPRPSPTSSPTDGPTLTPPSVPTDTPVTPPTHRSPTNTPRPTRTQPPPPTNTPRPTHTQPPPPTNTPHPTNTHPPPPPPTRTKPPYPPPPPPYP